MFSWRAIAFVAGIPVLLGGCQYVGPIAIDQGRDRYNHIIESTSKEQTFANILRVYYHEPTLFMDVTEVDATTTMSGAASGAITNIGARAGNSGGTLAGQTGGFNTGVTYSESPLIRYQPLLGQALVAQLATPVSVEAIWYLYQSGWDVTPLLDLSTAWLTLDSDEFFAALNTVAELDGKSALQLVAEKSDVTKAKDEMASGKLNTDQKANVILQVTNKAATPGTSDALVIYHLPYHPHDVHKNPREKLREDMLWRQLLRLYAGTQPKCLSGGAPGRGKADAGGANKARCTLHPTDSIEVRTMPVTAEKRIDAQIISGAPMMRTNSALGILKSAIEEPTPRIEFVNIGQYERIRSRPWNDPQLNKDLVYYTLTPDELKPDKPKLDVFEREALGWLADRSPEKPTRVYLPPNPERQFDDFVNVNRVLGQLRRYILIIESDVLPPADAYVAHLEHGKWYYIDGNDVVSQKNFNLVSLFMTMMAVPPTTPPLSPAITVGGS